MTQEIQYSPVAFDNITPVLDVGDPSQAFLNSVRFSTASMKDQYRAEMQQYQRNQDIENTNMEKSMEEMKGLAELSDKASKKYIEFQNKRTKDKLSEIWATNFIEGADIDESKLSADYNAEEQTQSETSETLGVGLAQNLTKKGEPTVQDVADASRLRKYSGLEAVVAANAKAQAAMQSYGPALSKWLGKTQPEPGAKTNESIREFNKRWADATGMSAASPGFTAKHVYPTLRREAAAENDAYTRGWNAAESAKTRDMLTQGLADGTIGLDSYFKQARGLVKADGKTLMNNDDIWSSLSGRFTPAQLARMGRDNFAVTGKPYKNHPRFNQLVTEARGQQQRQYNLYRAESVQVARTSFQELGPNATKAQLELKRNELIGQGVPLDIVDAQLTEARRSSAEAAENRKWSIMVDQWMEANPGKKIPASVIGNAPMTVRNQYASMVDQDVKNQNASEVMRSSESFKDFGKDFKSTMKTIVGKRKFANFRAGTSDPSNYNAFKSQALTTIIDNANVLMLGDPNLDGTKAFEQAKNSWIEAIKKQHAAGELMDKKGNSFIGVSDAMPDTATLTADVLREAQELNKVTTETLPDVLTDEEISTIPANGRFGRRINYLAGRMGLTPKGVVDLARAKQGLPKLENTPVDDAIGMIPQPQLARMASVDNPPLQLGLRGQCASGQTMTGSAQQRTTALGQQLLSCGVKGIWQHPDFSYDSGYTGSGKERLGGHAPNSSHKYNEALDIAGPANSPQQLEMIYQYLKRNKANFGIRELFYDPSNSGRDGSPTGHTNHVHVSMDHRISSGVGGNTSNTTQSTNTTAPSGGKLNRDNIAGVMRQAGWDESLINEMSAVAMAESGGDAGIDTVQSGLDPSRSNEYSVGLFQINYKAHKPMLDQMGISEQDLRDPVTNAKVAKRIYEMQGKGAWGAYTNGSYRQHL